MATIDDILDGVLQQRQQAVIPPFAPEIKGAGEYNPPTEANETVTSPPSVATPTLTQQDGGGGRKRMSLVELTKKFSTYKEPTVEELEKEQKRKKRDSVLASIGDGLSAFHHAYSTAAGTKSMVDPRVSLTGRIRDRYDKLKKERDAQKAAYNSAYMKAVMMDEERADGERKWQRQLGLDKAAADMKEREMKIKEAKDERAAALDNVKTLLYLGKITGQEYENKIKEIQAQYQNALSQSQVNRNNRSGGSRGGNRAPGEYPWYDKDGNLRYAHSYEAMRQNAQLNGTWNEATQESTSVRKKGRQTTTTTTTKPAKGHSTKPEPQQKSQQKKKNRLGL